MPRGTALSATVVDAKDGNTVSIVLDKATPQPGQEWPWQASLPRWPIRRAISRTIRSTP